MERESNMKIDPPKKPNHHNKPPLNPGPNMKQSQESRHKTFKLREFWRDKFLKMSEKEMKAYANDPNNPYPFRVYCLMFLQDTSFDNFYKLAEQTEGKLKETVEISNLPPIDLDCFGVEDEDKPKDS